MVKTVVEVEDVGIKIDKCEVSWCSSAILQRMLVVMHCVQRIIRTSLHGVRVVQDMHELIKSGNDIRLGIKLEIAPFSLEVILPRSVKEGCPLPSWQGPKTLKKFDFVTESGEHVHLTKEHISAQKKIEEEVKAKAARREGEIRKEELIDLLGLEVVNKYYNDKLQYDKYYDKMLNRIAASRITNCDVLTRKGPITLKVYRDDGTSETIPNFKASDLHLGEWREVMEACLKRTGKGWEIIYKQIGTRMDYIHTTEADQKTLSI
ncbi:hypothetical protein Tco_0154067 [Tanacetum coccineum]